MENIRKILEKSGFKAERIVYKEKKGEVKPNTYFTFQRLTRIPVLHTDDTVKAERETYMIRLITRSNFENLLDNTIKELRNAGYDVTSVDQESYEKDTGYFIVPITIQTIKE